MMEYLAQATGLQIPEGDVVKITDEAGNLIWEKVSSRLPSEYQEVEYIYIPDTGYINTEWVPSEKTLFNIRFKSKSQYVFGTGKSPRLAISFSPTNNTQVYNTNNSVSGIQNFTALGEGIIDVETFSTDSGGTYTMVNGDKRIHSGAISTAFDKNLPMLLGAWSYDATTIRQSSIDLYYSKATVDGIVEYELIPCYRKSDNVIGMYDIVRNMFLTNAGTDTFTKGPDVNSGGY